MYNMRRCGRVMISIYLLCAYIDDILAEAWWWWWWWYRDLLDHRMDTHGKFQRCPAAQVVGRLRQVLNNFDINIKRCCTLFGEGPYNCIVYYGFLLVNMQLGNLSAKYHYRQLFLRSLQTMP